MTMVFELVNRKESFDAVSPETGRYLTRVFDRGAPIGARVPGWVHDEAIRWLEGFLPTEDGQLKKDVSDSLIYFYDARPVEG